MIRKHDIVRLKNPSFEHEKGNFRVLKVDTSRIGMPVYIEHLTSGFKPMYPPTIDMLEIVQPTKMSDEKRRIIELENELRYIKNFLRNKFGDFRPS